MKNFKKTKKEYALNNDRMGFDVYDSKTREVITLDSCLDGRVVMVEEYTDLMYWKYNMKRAINLEGIYNKNDLDKCMTINNPQMIKKDVDFTYRGYYFSMNYMDWENQYPKFVEKVFDVISIIDRRIDGPIPDRIKKKITLREVFELKWSQNGNASGTIVDYGRIVRNVFKPILDFPIREITQEQLNELVNNVEASALRYEKLPEGKKRNELSPKRADKAKWEINSTMDFAVKRGYLDHGIEKFKPLEKKIKSRPIRVLKKETTHELINFLEDYESPTFNGVGKKIFMLQLSLMLGTGMRFTEAKEFTVSDFKIIGNTGIAIITKTTQSGDEIVLKYSENSIKNRIVPVDEYFSSKIEDYLIELNLKSNPNCKIFRLDTSNNDDSLVDKLRKLRYELKERELLDTELINCLTITDVRYTAGFNYLSTSETFHKLGSFLGTEYTASTIMNSEIIFR